MRTDRHCPSCGVKLLDDDGGACPVCLFRLAFEPASSADGPPPPHDDPSPPPFQVGPYRILTAIGRGGMGVVYLAEQEHPIRRKVALKVIKLGMDTREVVARFDTERQALALMSHANIARVFDAGAFDDGRPYFVMEYVAGVPITDYCDRNRLSTRERLALFVPVCQAVQHAHQRGIIHRDLKPSNVLVATEDGRAVPKIIDFGIAKATDLRRAEETALTRDGVLIGTPEYMSPEQADPGALAVGTTTDIYSLGVVLYELLAGVVPFEVDRLRNAAYGEVLRVVREEEPRRPSLSLTGLGARAGEIASLRDTDAPSLQKQLRGDLDWIILRALEKDPARRYPSASEFAADIERHLCDEPVVASPPSALYRLRKTVRKHRVIATAAAAVIVTLAAGLAVSTLIFVSAREARNLSDLLLDQSERGRATAANMAAEAYRQQELAKSERNRLVSMLLLLRDSAATGNGQAAPATEGAPPAFSRLLPLVAEHRYMVTASVCPLLISWYRRDNVGEATLRWRAGDGGRRGFELLIGSEPKRASGVNRWGYLAEEVAPGKAALLAVMRESNEETLADAEKTLADAQKREDKGARQFGYKAIRTEVTGSTGRTGTARVVMPRDATYHDLEGVLALLPSSLPAPREYDVVAEARPGYLPTLQDVLYESIAWYGRGAPAKESPVGRVVRYTYNGTLYELVLRSSKLLPSATYRGRPFSDLVDSHFVITNKKTNETTEFEIQFVRQGAMAGVPVHGLFRPRWWFEIQITKDDAPVR